MKFIIDAHQVHMTPRVIGAIEDRLRNECAYEPAGAEHSSKHQSNWKSKAMGKNAWDGKVRLLRKTTGKEPGYAFPTGLLPRVMRIVSKLYPNPTVEGLVSKPFGQEPDFAVGGGAFSPWPHQERLVRAALKSNRGLLLSPTGSGKSRVVALLVHNLQKRGRILITVPAKTLMHQLHGTLTGLGFTVGRLGDGHAETNAPIIVCTFQSFGLHREEPWVEEIQSWIIDEAHFADSDSFKKASAVLCNTQFRYGLTATLPSDGSEMEVEGLIGPVLETVTPLELIEAGILARPSIQVHYLRHSTKLRVYKEAHQQLVCSSGPRNDLIEKLVYENAPRGPLLVLVSNLQHGELLQYELQQRYGMDSLIFLEGSDSQKARNEQVRRLVDTKGVLIASTIFDVGVDIPELATIVLAGGGVDPGRTMQRIGRGLRITETKKTCTIIDIADRGQKQLERQADERLGLYHQVYRGMVTEYEKGQPVESVRGLTLGDFLG